LLALGATMAAPASGEQPVSFAARGAAGTALEGMLQPAAAGSTRAAVVICHADPRAGGSMDNELVRDLQRALAHAGLVTLRFNFRGVGRSAGTFAGGTGEVDDCLGAIDFLRQQAGVAPARVVVVGYSFGAVVGLHACVRDGNVPRCICIGFPTRSQAELAPTAVLGQITFPTLFVAGTEDIVCRLGVLDDAIRAAGVGKLCQLEAIEGGDHFFSGLTQRSIAVKRIIRFVSAAPTR